MIGYQAGRGTELHNKSGNIFLGYQAGYHDTTDNKLYIENSPSSTPLIYGDFENDTVRINGTLDVNNAFHFPLSDGTTGQVLQTDGSGVLSWNSDGGATEINELTDGKTGGNSVFLGSGAGANDDGSNNQNTAVGIAALNANTSGSSNTAIGAGALADNTSANNNIAIGVGALANNTIGEYNLAIGGWSNFNNYTGSRNTIMGYQAGYSGYEFYNNKSANVFIGYQAGYGSFEDYISINSNLGVGTSYFGNGTRILALRNATVPTSSHPASVFLYAEDVSASAELKVRDGAGNVTTLSPHNFSMIKKCEPMAWSFYSENHSVGKMINVDILRMVRLVEEVTGEKLAYVKNIDDDTDNINMEDNTNGIIQQQQKDIDELKKFIEGQQKIIEELKTRIEKLEKK